MRLFCLTQLRNEERFLPGFLHHIAPYVDGIIALDDGSTDATPHLLAAEPKVISVLRERRAGAPHAHEGSNRHRLTVEAARLGADWVICADADERYEERFLRRLRPMLAARQRRGQPVLLVKSAHLWNSPQYYRVDGRCAPRWTARLFRIPHTISRRDEGMHRPWFPPELDGAPRGRLPVLVYHLRMIERADRERRYQKFTAIDPDNTHQAIGYDHLVDETGLTLEPVLPFRAYRDLPAGAAPPALDPPALTGCLADPAFVARFRLDLTRRAPTAEAGPIREWSHLYGLDVDAIFDALRAPRS